MYKRNTCFPSKLSVIGLWYRSDRENGHISLIKQVEYQLVKRNQWYSDRGNGKYLYDKVLFFLWPNSNLWLLYRNKRAFFLFSDIPVFKRNGSLSYESRRNEKVSVKFIPDDAPTHVCIPFLPHSGDFLTTGKRVDVPQSTPCMTYDAPFDGPSGAAGQFDQGKENIVKSQ